MGTLREFSCQDCGYRAEVSGGPDSGWSAWTRTMLCRGCRNLVDVSVGRHGYGTPAGEDGDEDATLGWCSHCGSNAIEPWSPDGPCPRCGGPMTKGEVTVDWD